MRDWFCGNLLSLFAERPEAIAKSAVEIDAQATTFAFKPFRPQESIPCDPIKMG